MAVTPRRRQKDKLHGSSGGDENDISLAPGQRVEAVGYLEMNWNHEVVVIVTLNGNEGTERLHEE
jgi:hypothetical protein